ncbi:hypothetical protein NDU88_006615 [Pleurodeles waltl]|uniref:Uncharacterized protein n=1 Tax=Pleurodeles waltl TaxID=8319 RepID=A0AAV7SQ12_PLEWA|nr:hypothetical protein NDU88_006615 [Pleurodeles waltl]
MVVCESPAWLPWTLGTSSRSRSCLRQRTGVMCRGRGGSRSETACLVTGWPPGSFSVLLFGSQPRSSPFGLAHRSFDFPKGDALLALESLCCAALARRCWMVQLDSLLLSLATPHLGECKRSTGKGHLRLCC